MLPSPLMLTSSPLFSPFAFSCSFIDVGRFCASFELSFHTFSTDTSTFSSGTLNVFVIE